MWLDEMLTLVIMEDLDENQYLDVFIYEGEIKHAIPRDRWLGYFTLGFSTYFTEPYITVTGSDNDQNREVLERLTQQMHHRGITYKIHNAFYDS